MEFYRMHLQNGDENKDVTVNLKMDQLKLMYNACMWILQEFDEDDFPDMAHFKKLRRELQNTIIMSTAEEVTGVLLDRQDLLKKFGITK